MDTGQSLFAEIRPEQFDLAELHWLLLQRSRSASQPSPNEVVYRGDLADYTVKLRLGDAGEVSDILVAPSFKERDALRDQIVSELLTSAGPRIASVILFSDLPVDGYYKHGTVLQIVPAPREAPRPKFLLGEHPFLLQFSFPSSTNWAVRKIRKETRGREIAFVLAGLLAGSVHSLSGGEHHWILHLGKPEGVTSEYLQAGYVCPGLVDESDAFSPIQNLAALPQLEPRVYYFRWGLSGESKFEVPTNLSELLDGFFKLPSMRRNQFVRACYWFSLAGQFYVCSRSAAFAALVSSLEALMEPERNGPACESCGKPAGKSVSQRFMALLDEMAPWGPQVAAARKKLYSVRSALLHGARLLPSDYLGLSPGPRLGEEFEDMHHAQCLVRLVLANWLAKYVRLSSTA